MNAPHPNPLLELRKLGESVWLDDIGRGMLDDGSLARLIREDGLAGLTSNPSILAHSIMHQAVYAQRIARLLPTVSSSMALYEELALADLHDAAALLRPLYDSTKGGDGFVSLEVSPHLADDSTGSFKEAQRLWQRLAIPNAFIKIPGTEAGVPVIRDLIASGVNVNVTLLFSPERYRAVVRAYRDGLSRRVAQGQPIERVASVASFFLSRIDTAVDRLLDGLAARGQPAARALRGKAAIASACRAYEICEESTADPAWQALAARGARPQRLLWASTSTKDPAYSPIKYVEELVVPGTVNTMPLETLDAYRRLGRPELTLERHLAEASDVREGLERLDVDLEAVAQQLEREGVAKFVEPFDQLQKWLEDRRRG
ncbi:MAG: transaldolase [Gammaproteobacteria bacterium]|nr:transaldolase [Gammaproteobacteria bacterium]MBV8973865.1 transaldolase [Nevskiaceae bacterium]MBV9318063.1 transaldolase [Gammaproteobacteria bacterium]MBV9724818.1 transaldolase [Gammaproteobacteria bacterium]